MRNVLTCALVLVLAVAVAADAAQLSLEATRDARIMGHRAERDQNGGKCSRLRTVGVVRGSAEFMILDFDRAKLKGFLEKQKDKKISGTLQVQVREMHCDKVKVEVATLDAGADWAEGERCQKKAKKGECCALAARMDEAKWTTADGKEVERFRDLVYDGDKITTRVNSAGVEVTRKDEKSYVEIKLDEAFVKHLAAAEHCRGLFLFHRDKQAKVDFFSREQNRREPKLVVTAE
jgi:hypothetical protein